jgi:DNA-binding response OmpR family regulator
MADMKSWKILLLEDEAALAEIVKEVLESKGFTVVHVETVESAQRVLEQYLPDIFVLDVMLPDGDGFNLLKQIRLTNSITPAIFLTSKSLPTDVVAGFESGANDYLKKPFSMEELVVRIKSLLGTVQNRQIPEKSAKGPLTIGEFTYHYPEGVLVYQGTKKPLTYREAEILFMLINHQDEILLRSELLIKFWDNDDYFSGRSLDVFITKLRKYLKKDPSLAILNFRGKGYKLIS